MKKRSLVGAVVLATLLFPLTAVAGVKAAPAGAGGPMLHLQVGTFDAAGSTGPKVARVRPLAPDAAPLTVAGTPSPWVFQSARPEGQAAVAAAVQASGATMVGYLPDQAYAVYATPEQRLAVVNQVGPLLHFSGPLQPAWRIAPGLTQATGGRDYVVNLLPGLSDGERAAGFEALAGLAGVRMVKGRSGDEAVRVSTDAARLGAVAAVRQVAWVNRPAEFKLMNATARWVTDTGARQVLHLTDPASGLGLTGAGQTAAVADTGINYLPDVKGDAQAYFSDCPAACKDADFTMTFPGGDPTQVDAHNTNHRKLSAFFDLGDSGARPADPDAHGTHTGGSVAGNIAPYGELNRADGLAWEARLVDQNIASPDGSLGGIPTDLGQLFAQAYKPSAPVLPNSHGPDVFAAYNPLQDARTHNNSWGTAGNVASAAADNANALDRFVWNHEDMAIVVSAGNEATAVPPSAGSVGSPATAKNDLTSAASANGDQPQVSPLTLASFSSHGPTNDGRFGPDLATPGQVVVSPKGSSAEDEHYLQGTSMSAPILTGISTLVRQYFWDGYGPVLAPSSNAGGMAVGTPSADRQFNPSAALVKAVLVNGARRMTGFYTGDDGGDRAQDGQYPSNGQGFGLVNLDNSLFLPNDPTNLWVKDVWRDTYNGKAVNPDVANTPNPEAFTAPSVPQTRSYMLHVLPGQPLDVTLAWTDQPSLDPAVPTLINDLNLTVTGPDAVVRKGNAFNTRTAAKAATWETGAGGSADNRNNVERVRVEAPAEGDYTVTVSTGTLSGTQNQGFALAAAGQITGSGAPALGSGWKVDETPNAAPTVVSSTVENVSSDTAVVNVATSELTKAVLTTTNGGVFPSVDTVGADGDFGQLTSGFTPEIPDNTGFPPAAGAHDVLAREHRIRITGPRARDVNMSVQLTDLEGKTATVFLGTLPAEAVYQPPLDDIAQFSSVDDTYGGFGGKSTQMYLGNLTGLGSLLGAYKFTLPPTVDAATVGGAVVEASSGHDLASHDAQQWKMRTDMLPNATESGWQTKKYADIHSATAIASLNPSTSVRKGNQSTYAQAVTCTQMEDFRGNVADHNVAFRMEADTPETDAAVSFETGVNRRSRGPEFRPRLVLLKQQPDGTLLDSRPCDPNAPAPAISDVRVEQNKNTDGTTYSGVVSWRTDVPSDSTVVIRPKGANALSWTEVAVPGRTTTHIVEVRGLSLDQDYEFVVNSASCNGANTTATNNSQGYAFVAPGTAPVSNAAGPYDFESDQGWTVTQENRGDGFPTSSTTWTRGPGGWHSVGQSYEATPYQDFTNTALASPSFATTAGRVRVSWWQQVDLEPDSDFLYLEYNNGGGWIEAAKFTGQHGDFSNNTFEPQTVVFDLTPSPALRVRFRLESDLAVSNPTYKGARVDDVAVAQGGRGEPLGPFASKAPSAGSSVTAPVVPLRLKPNAADLAAGTARCAPITTKVVLPPPPPPVNGYWLTAADAGLFSYGAAGFVGSRGGQPLNQPVVGMAQNATDHKGYWQVASDGGIFNYGSAGFFGSMGSTPLNRPVVGMAAAPDGKGYWLVAADGGIFNFGSARFFGSTGSMTLNKPIVGMAATADGGGYWLVASDGGIFAFGNAVGRWYGSTGDMTLVSPVVGMEPTPLGDGYWLVARDGGVFAFGKAAALYHGSAQSRGVNNIVGMAAAKDGLGYWLVGANGSVYNFGNAPAFGGAEGLSLVRPVVGIDGY